jgi:hypothetical protein
VIESKEIRTAKFKGALMSHYIKWAIDHNLKDDIDAYYSKYKAGLYADIVLEPWVILFFRMKELTIN